MQILKGLFLFCLFKIVWAEDSEVEKVFKELELIPDVLTDPPQEFLKVEFDNGLEADRGNELTPTQSKDEPKLSWTTEPDAFYTIIMSNADPPSRAEPIWREWLHWLVVNVPSNQIDKGEVFDPYLGPAPPKTSGLLRYVFLVYKQPGKLEFDEPTLNNTSVEGHSNFSSMKFAQKYGLETLVAGNSFQAGWDSLVPYIYKQLGINL